MFVQRKRYRMVSYMGDYSKRKLVYAMTNRKLGIRKIFYSYLEKLFQILLEVCQKCLE